MSVVRRWSFGAQLVLTSGSPLRLLLRFVVVMPLVGEAQTLCAAATLSSSGGGSSSGQLCAGGSCTYSVGGRGREVIRGCRGAAGRDGTAVEVHGGAVMHLQFDACKTTWSVVLNCQTF